MLNKPRRKIDSRKTEKKMLRLGNRIWREFRKHGSSAAAWQMHTWSNKTVSRLHTWYYQE